MSVINEKVESICEKLNNVYKQDTNNMDIFDNEDIAYQKEFSIEEAKVVDDWSYQDTDNPTIMSSQEPFNNSACVAEHKIYYDIYYNELKLFYQKTTIFTTIQLGMFTGVILKYTDLKATPWILAICLLFLVSFSILELLVSIRGNHVNNAVIETISKFERDTGFVFLNEFEKNVHKGSRIKTMNFPSLMIIAINILFLLIWGGLTLNFILSLIKTYSIDIYLQEISYFYNKTDIIFIPLLSIVFSVTMKVADLLDEHGLHLFKYADILFGVIWGISGALLVLSNTVIANILLAMIIGFVIRRRLDYPNHIIAFCIIISTFFLFSDLNKLIFFSFLIAIVLLGLLKDMKYNKTKGKVFSYIEKIYLYIPLIYAFPSFVYSLLNKDWIVFTTFFFYDLTYNITRIIAKKKKWYKE